MALRSLKLPVICGLAAIFLAACSSSDDLDLTTSWLGPLHNYERVGAGTSGGLFILKDVKPAAADRILLAPAEITVSVESDLNSISPRAYERIRRLFADALARELSKQPNNTSDNADAYIVHIALTNLTAKRIGKEISATALSDLKFSFGTAAVKAELRHQQTNSRDAVILMPAPGPETTTSGLPGLLASFAEKISARVSQARTELSKRSRAPVAPKPAAKQ